MAKTIVPTSLGGVSAVGGDHAERYADDDGERQRHDRQLDRGGEPVDEQLGDRAPLGHRLAEVAVEEVDEVAPELDDDRLVEAGVLGELGARRFGRPLAELRLARIAGITRARMNTESTMPNSTGIDESRRWMMKRIMENERGRAD